MLVAVEGIETDTRTTASSGATRAAVKAVRLGATREGQGLNRRKKDKKDLSKNVARAMLTNNMTPFGRRQEEGSKEEKICPFLCAEERGKTIHPPGTSGGEDKHRQQ